jgi:hypothetical protein
MGGGLYVTKIEKVNNNPFIIPSLVGFSVLYLIPFYGTSNTASAEAASTAPLLASQTTVRY